MRGLTRFPDVTFTENSTLAGVHHSNTFVRKSEENVDEWGVQHPEEVLSAIGEEFGEIEKAYLEATHAGPGGGVSGHTEVRDEVYDLGALLLQLLWSLEQHPMAFKPLPTADEASGGEEP